MTTAKRIAKNSAFIFLGDAIGAILQLILVVYLIRCLGDVTFGKYAFAFAFTSLFTILSDLGLSVLSIREIARDTSKAGEYLTNISIKELIGYYEIQNFTEAARLTNQAFGVQSIALVQDGSGRPTGVVPDNTADFLNSSDGYVDTGFRPNLGVMTLIESVEGELQNFGVKI